MKDFITYDIDSVLTKDQIFHEVNRTLPAFAWRRGDSEAQGSYISGLNDEFIQMKLWLEEHPIRVSVSFRRAWLGVPDRENRKRQLVDLISNALIPSFGSIVKMDA